MSSFIGISSETGGAGCDVRLSCYCCYSRILTAFTQSHSSFYCSRPKAFPLVGLSGRRFLWDSRTLWIPLGGVAIIVGIAYWRLLPDIAKVNKEWGTDTPPTSMGYIPQVFTAFMGVGYVALLSLLLLLAGSWSAVREKRGLLLLCGAIILGPILMSLQGVSVPSWAYARYLIFSLPLLLILIAEGIDWVAIHVQMGRGAAVVAWGLTAIVVFGWIPLVHAQFLAKEEWPYAQVATFLHTQMQKSDVIVTGRSIGLSLSQFFDNSEDRIMLPDSYVSKVASNLDGPLSGRVFYVTGPGFLKDRKAPVRRFGKSEVTIYGGDTARALLQQWRRRSVASNCRQYCRVFSRRLSTTRAARRGVTIWPFGRSVALTRRELPGSEAIRALYSTPPTEGRTIRRIPVKCVRRALPIRRIGPLT